MPQFISGSLPTNRALMSPPDAQITEYEVGANATEAEMIPGNVVIFDTVDGDVKEAGAAANGVLGVIEVSSGGLLTTGYAVGEKVPIIDHIGAKVVVNLAAGQTITPGDAIVAAANGQVTEVAVAALGSQGDIIGIALMSLAAAGRLLIILKLQREGAAVA